MKKTSKILVLLLSVVAILTAFSVVTLAAENSADSYHVFNIDQKWDSADLSDGDEIWAGGSSARYGRITVRVAPDGNKYVVFSPKTGNPNNFVEPALDTSIGTDKNFKYNPKDYPYMMFSLDVMVPEGASIHTGPSLNFYVAQTSARTGAITKIDFGPQIVISDFSAYLAKTPGVWEHVSIIMEHNFDTDAETGKVTYGTVTYHYFVNDVYAYSSQPKSISYFKNYLPEDLGYVSIRNNGAQAGSESDKVAVDNYKMTYFDTTFGTSKETMLSEMVSTVYNKDYDMPFGVTAATIVRAGQTFYFDDVNEAVAAAEPNETIYLAADVDGIVSVDKYIKIDRNVYDKNGEATGEYYDITYSSATLVPDEVDGVVSFISAMNAQVEVFWDDCDALWDENEDSNECYCPDEYHGHIMQYTTTAMLNTIPVYPGTVPEFEVVDGVVKAFKGWSYTRGGEVEELRKITREDCENTFVTLYPVYEVVQYNIQIKDLAGNVSYHKTDEIYTAILSATSGSTVTFLTDIETESGITINKNITIDFNGKTYKKLNVSAIQYKAVDNGDGTYKKGSVQSYGTKGAIFYLDGSSYNFNITSSKPGARIFHGSYMATNDLYLDGKIVAQETYDRVMGGSLIGNGGINSVTVNITGQNLEFFGSCVVDVDNGATRNCVINIDGGVYNRAVNDYSALITNRAGAAFNFKNAVFNGNGATLIYLWKSKGTDHQAMTFTNCDFINGNFYTNDVAVATFIDCRIMPVGVSKGSDPSSAFVFGENTNLLEKPGANTAIAEGFELIEYAYEHTYSLSNITSFKINAGKTDFVYSAFDNTDRTDKVVSYTYKVVDPAAALATVKWVDANGRVLATTKVLKNSLASAPTDASVPTGDEYRNQRITRWTNANGEENYLIGDADEYVFTAAPAQEGDEVVYVANITDARLNLRYFAQFHVIFYLPYNEDMEAAPEVTGGFEKPGTVLINGKKFWSYEKYSATNIIFKDNVQTVKFVIDGVTYTQRFNPNGLIYAEILLNDPQANEFEKSSVGNMVRFVRESLEAYGSNSIPYDRINALIGSEDGSVKGVCDLPDYIANNEYPDIACDAAELAEYIESIHFKMSGAYAAYVFTKTDKAIAEGATISVKSASGAWSIRDNTGASKTPWTLNLRVYHAIETMTVTVNVPAQGEEAAKTLTAKYSIGAYINATDSDLAKALYAFGAAAQEYRANRKDY